MNQVGTLFKLSPCINFKVLKYITSKIRNTICHHYNEMIYLSNPIDVLHFYTFSSFFVLFININLLFNI